jgi:hypothetical protein
MIEAHPAEAPSDTPFDKPAALQSAVDTFRRNADYLKPGGQPGKLPLPVKYHRTGQRESIELGYDEHSELIHDDEILAIGEKAHEGHEEAVHFLSEIAAKLIEQGDPLPAPLREFVAEALRHPRQRRRPGRRRFDLVGRNHVICFVITMIDLRWGFSPTRNEATERASAASIAQQALQQIDINLGEGAIAKIWNGDDGRCWKQTLARRKQMPTIM